MPNKKCKTKKISRMTERYYTHDQKEYLLGILSKRTNTVIQLMKEKYGIELKKYNVYDARRYYGIKQKEKAIYPNLKPMYFEKTDKNGYVWIKTKKYKRKGNKFIEPFELKQRYVYEQHYGKIPNGYMVCFIDGDKTNFDIKNLGLVKCNYGMLLSMKKHRYITNNKLLNDTYITLFDLKKKNRELKREYL